MKNQNYLLRDFVNYEMSEMIFSRLHKFLRTENCGRRDINFRRLEFYLEISIFRALILELRVD